MGLWGLPPFPPRDKGVRKRSFITFKYGKVEFESLSIMSS